MTEHRCILVSFIYGNVPRAHYTLTSECNTGSWRLEGFGERVAFVNFKGWGSGLWGENIPNYKSSPDSNHGACETLRY